LFPIKNLHFCIDCIHYYLCWIVGFRLRVERLKCKLADDTR